MLYRKPEGSAVGNGEGAASDSTSEEAPWEDSIYTKKGGKKSATGQRTFQTQDMASATGLGGMF